MIDVEDTTSNLVHELSNLLLGDECFDGDFARNEGNEIVNRVRIQEAVDDRNDLFEADLLPPHSVRDGLKFWERDGDVVFPKVTFQGDNADGRRRFRGHGGIVSSTNTSGDDGDRGLHGRHGGAIVVVGGALNHGWYHTTSHTTFRSW